MIKNLLLISLLLFTSVAIGGGDPVARAVITTGLDSNAQPVSNLTTVDNTVGNVVFYTEIVGMNGRVLAHRWTYGDRVIATININVRSNASRTWTRASVDRTMIGDWTVAVVDPNNGEVFASRTFEVASPRTLSIQQRVVQQYSSDCEQKLRDLDEQLAENPDSPYLKFLRQQQQSRCQPRQQTQQQIQQQR